MCVSIKIAIFGNRTSEIAGYLQRGLCKRILKKVDHVAARLGGGAISQRQEQERIGGEIPDSTVEHIRSLTADQRRLTAARRLPGRTPSTTQTPVRFDRRSYRREWVGGLRDQGSLLHPTSRSPTMGVRALRRPKSSQSTTLLKVSRKLFMSASGTKRTPDLMR